jgi:hypothetical protein
LELLNELAVACRRLGVFTNAIGTHVEVMHDANGFLAQSVEISPELKRTIAAGGGSFDWIRTSHPIWAFVDLLGMAGLELLVSGSGSTCALALHRLGGATGSTRVIVDRQAAVWFIGLNTLSVSMEAQAGWQPSSFDKTFPSMIPSKYSVDLGSVGGENIADIKTLLHRFRMTNTVTSDNTEIIPEFAYRDEAMQTLGSMLISMYMFWRGSVRAKIRWNPAIHIAGEIALRPANGTFDDFPDPSLTALPPHFYDNITANGAMVFDSAYNPVSEFEIPFYNRTRCIFVPTALTAPDAGGDNGRQNSLAAFRVYPYLAATYTGVASTLGNVYEAVGDDFDVGLLSAPPLLFQQEDFPAPPQ